MPDPNNKVPETIPGPYYVDDTCIDCDLCRGAAPQFFTRHDPSGFSYVHRQPHTSEEIAQAEEARIGCPADSIGNDGADKAPHADLAPAGASGSPSESPAQG